MKTWLVLPVLLASGCSPRTIENTLEKTREKAEAQAAHVDKFSQIKREVDSIDLQNKAMLGVEAGQSDAIRTPLVRLYFRAFEFQKWTGEALDTPEFKHQLYRKALTFFFPVMASYMPEDYELKPWVLSSERRRLGLFAALMDEVDPMQDGNSRERGLEIESINGLIEHGLARDGSPGLETYVSVVQEWRREAIYLLQMRQIYLDALVIERLTGMDLGYINQLTEIFTTHPLITPELTPELIAQIEGWQRKAESTRAFLTRIGVEPVVNPLLTKRLRHVLKAFEGLRASHT